jgi:hypothetical protein
MPAKNASSDSRLRADPSRVWFPLSGHVFIHLATAARCDHRLTDVFLMKHIPSVVILLHTMERPSVSPTILARGALMGALGTDCGPFQKPLGVIFGAFLWPPWLNIMGVCLLMEQPAISTRSWHLFAGMLPSRAHSFSNSNGVNWTRPKWDSKPSVWYEFVMCLTNPSVAAHSIMLYAQPMPP